MRRPDDCRERRRGESGRAAQAHAVATLAATSRQSALAAALAEICRIERTIFTLEWMLEPELRHRVQTSLNKGEARNNLARSVFLNRLGQLHDRTHGDQQHRAAGCNLVVAAIILWNILSIWLPPPRRSDAAASTCQTSCSDMSGRWAWDHVSLTGDYRWSADNAKDLDPTPPPLPRPSPSGKSRLTRILELTDQVTLEGQHLVLPQHPCLHLEMLGLVMDVLGEMTTTLLSRSWPIISSSFGRSQCPPLAASSKTHLPLAVSSAGAR